MKVQGIAKAIVDKLLETSNRLGQGRNCGVFGLVNEQGIIDCITPLVEGGISGLPLRQLLKYICNMEGRPVIEGLMSLPDNAVFIITRPGKSGLITDVSGINFFGCSVVAIGIKHKRVAGIGYIDVRPDYFDLGTKAERVDLDILAADNMNEERRVLQASNELAQRFLYLSEPVSVVETELKPWPGPFCQQNWQLQRFEVNTIAKELAQELVVKSTEVGQGREVAVIGIVDEKGHVTGMGKPVVGGMGYIPSRLIASSAVDISGRSLKEIYAKLVPENAVFVHTHPGGTGVMHMGDAMAGPGTWGRPIIAIGHDQDGNIKGATVIEVREEIFRLADEDEKISQEFFQAETPEAEAEIRNRKFGIAQEFTALCKAIELV
ncbi:peptidase S7 [Carboxydocella sp. JDF658]|uniref:peptidase S7 n=1 Tax=Carboxydocella sp. JDF658 TaxID=1926600 RepID=UPI0009AC640C|nr:peptidase S7 [Carboxydocella sp. JDF658]GAW31782.1 peptidase S7 [Carboxydocella sp. JDF658]